MKNSDYCLTLLLVSWALNEVLCVPTPYKESSSPNGSDVQVASDGVNENDQTHEAVPVERAKTAEDGPKPEIDATTVGSLPAKSTNPTESAQLNELVSSLTNSTTTENVDPKQSAKFKETVTASTESSEKSTTLFFVNSTSAPGGNSSSFYKATSTTWPQVNSADIEAYDAGGSDVSEFDSHMEEIENTSVNDTANADVAEGGFTRTLVFNKTDDNGNFNYSGVAVVRSEGNSSIGIQVYFNSSWSNDTNSTHWETSGFQWIGGGNSTFVFNDTEHNFTDYLGNSTYGSWNSVAGYSPVYGNRTGFGFGTDHVYGPDFNNTYTSVNTTVNNTTLLANHTQPVFTTYYSFNSTGNVTDVGFNDTFPESGNFTDFVRIGGFINATSVQNTTAA